MVHDKKMIWTLGIVDYVYCTTESIEEITLKLENEKDGKSTGEVVVGVSGLRPEQTDSSSTNEPPKPNQFRPQQQTTPNQAHGIPPGMTLPPGREGVVCKMFSYTL